jgi:hypothetical protein
MRVRLCFPANRFLFFFVDAKMSDQSGAGHEDTPSGVALSGDGDVDDDDEEDEVQQSVRCCWINKARTRSW